MKYKLTKTTKLLYGRTLYQIKALKSFSYITKGELGGYIEKEGNLSQCDNCWVYGDAWVSGDAWVYGDARVYGDAGVSGDAMVYGNAIVYGDARVSGDGWVCGDVRVCGNAMVYGKLEINEGKFDTGYINKPIQVTQLYRALNEV